jgi:hypothetical protein
MATWPLFPDVTRWPSGTRASPVWRGLAPGDLPETPPVPPAAPGDGAAADGSPRVSIELFVSPDSPTSAAALRNIERALVGVERDAIRLDVCDVSVHPGRAAEAHVCFTPTLVIRSTDQPPIWIFGALTDAEILSEHLEVAGLQRSPRGD